MTPRLEVTDGPEKGRSFELDEGRSMVVGRGKPCHFCIRDSQVSRTHFLLEKGPAGFRICDMGSMSGTFVNGKKIQEHDLVAGDVIRVGQSELRFTLAESLEASTIHPALLPPPSPVPERGGPLSRLPGRTLAGLVIEGAIADGRLGTVFRAFDPKRRLPVALKVLRPELARDHDEMKRFVRAMKAVVPLRHPNVVSVYTAGKTRGYCFVVMEYIDGESLAQVLRRVVTQGMLDWTYALRVGIYVARALEAARQHEIVHGNVKPQNILVRREDNLAKLSDLMLAKAIEGTLAERVTRKGLAVGEAVYMSPERIAGDATPDVRSDIYSLGATLYALLTSRPTFEDSSLPTVMAKIQERPPDPPKKYQADVPDEFEGAVLRMLAKRPDDRFQTPAELLAELERIGAHHGLLL